MKNNALLLLATCLLVSVGVFAREVREQPLEEKVKASDFVFLGKVTDIQRPQEKIEGVKAFATVSVIDSLKGSIDGSSLNFVTSGFSAELNPACCEQGQIYLFFVTKGVMYLTLEGNEIGSARHLEEQFVSATNGKFSTYKIEGEAVAKWRGSDAPPSNVPLVVVRRQICQAMKN